MSFGEITGEAALTVAKAVQGKNQFEKLDLNGINLLNQPPDRLYSHNSNNWCKC